MPDQITPAQAQVAPAAPPAAAVPPTPLPAPPVAPLTRPPLASSAHRPAPTNIRPVTSFRRPWGAMLSVASVFVALVGLFIVYFMNTTMTSRIKAEENSIAQIEEQLKRPPLSDTDKTVRTVSSALTGYNGQLKQQVDYAMIIDALPLLLPASVTLDSLLIDEKGGLKISGDAPSFDVVGKLRLSLIDSPLLKDVSVDSVSMAQDKTTVSFNGQATINLERLKKQAPGSSPSPSPTPSVSPGQ